MADARKTVKFEWVSYTSAVKCSMNKTSQTNYVYVSPAEELTVGVGNWQKQRNNLLIIVMIVDDFRKWSTFLLLLPMHRLFDRPTNRFLSSIQIKYFQFIVTLMPNVSFVFLFSRVFFFQFSFPRLAKMRISVHHAAKSIAYR